MALLNELSRSIFYIPFEINKKSQLNLQVSEQFQISYMDKSHDQIKMRMDSAFGERDSGLKLSMIFCIETKTSQVPQFSLYENEDHENPGKSQSLKEDIQLKPNTLVLFNSRSFLYQINNVQSKSMILTNLVPGPPQPPLTPRAAFC